jgi:uncharacterized membrane protein YfcA
MLFLSKNQITAWSLCLVYALENIVDLLSACVVLWRFFAPTTIDDALEKKLKSREDRASVGISYIMVILGIGIIGTAFTNFTREAEDVFTVIDKLIGSLFSVLFFGSIAILKFRFANRLDSPSMHKDGICSLIGAILGATLFVNTVLVIGNPDAWWFDPVVAFFAGVAAIYLGVKALWEAYTVKGHPIFALSWWCSTPEDATSSNYTAVDSEIV